MVIDNVFGLNSTTQQPESASPNFIVRMLAAVGRKCARLWCGMHGHLILLHFEPTKLSLQCALCGYSSEGWDVGRPLVARRQVDNRAHSHSHNVRTERRRHLRAVPSNARMAS
jgi:hypothetical protein